MGMTSKILAPILIPATFFVSMMTLFTSATKINKYVTQFGMDEKQKAEASSVSKWDKTDEIAKSCFTVLATPSVVSNTAYFANDVYCDGESENLNKIAEFFEEFTIEVRGKNKKRDEKKICDLVEEEMKKYDTQKNGLIENKEVNTDKILNSDEKVDNKNDVVEPEGYVDSKKDLKKVLPTNKDEFLKDLKSVEQKDYKTFLSDIVA